MCDWGSSMALDPLPSLRGGARDLIRIHLYHTILKRIETSRNFNSLFQKEKHKPD